ncbi:MAG: ABC transporter ATP-binding protein [Limnobacter sp.]|nr:ABC transporter ATP-binding protein [Limnobacter sp.]
MNPASPAQKTSQPQRTPLFEVRKVSKHFGGLIAVHNMSLSIYPGTIAGLIGPNGAGKTTFFNLMSGLYTPDGGEFLFKGDVFSPKAPEEVAKMGIARTFQNIRLFSSMTALENIMVGCHCRYRHGVLGAIFKTRSHRQEEHSIREKSRALLDYVGIARYADELAGHLSYGDQRRLEIARALATQPDLLALDEPAAGMNATEKLRLKELLLQMRTDGKTILLIEHDVKLVMGICDHVTVLDYGKVIEEGSPKKVQQSPAVIEAYLGGLHHA